jgi:hypothetical protein
MNVRGCLGQIPREYTRDDGSRWPGDRARADVHPPVVSLQRVGCDSSHRVVSRDNGAMNRTYYRRALPPSAARLRFSRISFPSPIPLSRHSQPRTSNSLRSLRRPRPPEEPRSARCAALLPKAQRQGLYGAHMFSTHQRTHSSIWAICPYIAGVPSFVANAARAAWVGTARRAVRPRPTAAVSAKPPYQCQKVRPHPTECPVAGLVEAAMRLASPDAGVTDPVTNPVADPAYRFSRRVPYCRPAPATWKPHGPRG